MVYQKIEGLEGLVNLEELWLGKNKITQLEVCISETLLLCFEFTSCAQGLESLKKLKILSMQSNRITKLEGLEELKELDQLYLSHNGIEKIEGLEQNVVILLFPFP
jgi:protein phosphatase 1 regulatory subunit 7